MWGGATSGAAEVARPKLGLGTFGKIRHYRTSNGWRADTLYRDMDGRTRAVKRSGATKRAAEQALKGALLTRQHQAGIDLSGDHTFAQAGERWLEEIHRRRAGSTYDRYRTCLRNRVVPDLGALTLRECTTGVVDRYLIGLEDRLQANTLRGYRTVLTGVFGYAVRMDALTVNPVREVRPIEGKGKESRGLTRDEREDLLAKLDADRRAVADDLPDLMRYLLGTGVRIGEAAGLRWFRVDLDEGVVVHGDNLIRVTGQGLVLKEPKTEAGFRVLPLPDFVLMMLRLRYPGPRAGMAPVFPKFPMYPVLNPEQRRESRSGRRTFPYRPGPGQGGLFLVDAWRDPNNLGRSIRKFRTEAGYPWVTAHTFRHTSITICDQAGLQAREISGYHGHARPSFTQDRYMDRRQMSGAIPKALDAAMRPA